VPQPSGGRQHDPRPPDVLLQAVPVRHDRLEPSTSGGADFDLDPLAHGPKPTTGLAPRESFLRLDPLALGAGLQNAQESYVPVESRSDAVISFPKSGRTWLRVMLDELGVRAEYSHAGAGHRFAHHWRDLDTSASANFRRIVFLHRDPCDTVVSGYYQVDRRLGGYPGTLSDFIRDPHHGIEKIARYNAMWLQFVASHKNATTLAYEGMHADCAATLVEVLNFLGYGSIPSELISAVVSNNRFDKMQQRERTGFYANKYQGILGAANPHDPHSFKVRKGLVGDYHNEMSDADIAFCNEALERLGYPATINNRPHPQTAPLGLGILDA
jgi:Sulfotransferase domain